MTVAESQQALLEFASQKIVRPLRVPDPGGVLAPVKEWTRQFEGQVILAGTTAEFAVDNASEVFVPHDLGRRPFGATFLGFISFDFNGQPPIILVDLNETTNLVVRVVSDKNFTGEGRLLVV